jgi:hypothetical protein
MSARCETQRYLDCLTRQIAARARRQATTKRVRSRMRRLVRPRPYQQEFVDRLTFECWGELDTIACRLTMHEQVIGELQHRDLKPVSHQAA